METREEREARLHALEVETLLEQQRNGHQWTIGDDGETQFEYTRVDDHEEYKIPSSHKHMYRLNKLHDRISHWKAIGPACTEVEWDQMELDLEGVSETIRACTMDIHHVIPKDIMRAFNEMWNKYKIN